MLSWHIYALTHLHSYSITHEDSNIQWISWFCDFPFQPIIEEPLNNVQFEKNILLYPVYFSAFLSHPIYSTELTAPMCLSGPPNWPAHHMMSMTALSVMETTCMTFLDSQGQTETTKWTQLAGWQSVTFSTSAGLWSTRKIRPVLSTPLHVS